MESLDFRVGDKGWDVGYGNGYITEIDSKRTYGVVVRFNNNRIIRYTSDGKSYVEDLFRSLYHGHDLKVIGEQIPIREVWVNLWWNSITKEVVRTRTFYETEDIARKNTIPENQGNFIYLKTIQIKIPHN